MILILFKFSTIKVYGDNYTVKNINIIEQYDVNFKDHVISKGFEKAFETIIYKIVENKDKNLFKKYLKIK